jgi:hypothetical protein
MQLISEAHLNCALIGCTYVFQPERYSFVGICPERGDKHGHYLIFLLEHDLAVPRIAVKETEEYRTPPSSRRLDRCVVARSGSLGNAY